MVENAKRDVWAGMTEQRVVYVNVLQKIVIDYVLFLFF